MAKYNYPKIVVTGLGAVTPLGNTINEYWEGLISGTSGAAPITRFDASEYDTKFACEVKNFDTSNYINRKDVQKMDLFTQFAIVATAGAIEDANIDFEKLNRDEIGVIIGSGIGGMWTYHTQQETLYQRGGKPDRISPFFVPMLISDIAAGQVALKWGLKGPNYATVSACATSSHSIADAVMILQRGDADMMIAGGSEAVVCPMGVGGFNAMKALSRRNDAPNLASRPFDKNRDGFVIGEGAGILILETLEHAQKRGAKIYAEIAGFGMSDDAYHLTGTAPGGEGAVRSMRKCIKDANVNLEDIGYLNAHGTSTPLGDKSEADAIRTVFGDYADTLLVSSTKSMTGHLLGAAGAIEAIATIKAIETGILPPSINIDEQDSEININVIANKSVNKKVKAAISNTFGFGGHNASICFKEFNQ